MTFFIAIEMPDGGFRHETVVLTAEQIKKINLQHGEAVDEVFLDDDE
jgi:hypothetical protein